jgi:NADH-quinone oxidoreductase subunit M
MELDSSLGISYYLAADGISMVMVVLTGIASVAAVLFSWNIEDRANEFFGFFLTLIGGVYGVFISFDLFLLFVFYEIAIIPKVFPDRDLGVHSKILWSDETGLIQFCWKLIGTDRELWRHSLFRVPYPLTSTN